MTTKSEVKDGLLDMLKKQSHGLAKAKENIEPVNVKKDDVGTITAYLPDMNRFAMSFESGEWVTFEYTEEEFLEKFEIIK